MQECFKISGGVFLILVFLRSVSDTRTIDIWNGLREEVVAANSVHMFKEKLDKYGFGDRTI